MNNPILLPTDFKSSGSSWRADIPPKRATLFGQPLKIVVSRVHDTPEKTMHPECFALIQRILQALSEVLKQAAEALSNYHSYDPAVLDHLCSVCIELSKDATEGKWTLTGGRDDWPDYGWYIEFVGTEFQEIWAAD